ncbi:penicillin-binding transpeptidase domain-containing protein [Saccharopolyspora rosea]|uniref:Penicillin-binding transpeptidase domain-containing protein n=1 Tax=Saccharopolyspora rosea TaxID=524884 RepID=A0ABW3FT07_9PSEU
MRGARIFGTGLTGALVLLTSGCGLFDSGPSPQQTASDFLRAFAAGDNARAAQLTDNPRAARAMLDATRQGMRPTSLTARIGKVDTASDNPKASFNADWEFGGDRRWTYPGSLTMRQGTDTTGNDRWLVHWSPSVVYPKLTGQQTLRRSDQQATPEPVLDRDGKPLMQPQSQVKVMLNPQAAGDLQKTAGALAGALGSIDPGITQQSIVDEARQTKPGQAYLVGTLRDAAYQQVKDKIQNLPGVSLSQDQGLAAPNKDFASQVLTGVRKVADQQRDADSGWQVNAVNADGSTGASFVGEPPKPASPTSTTLSSQAQQAAEDALRPIPQAAMIVALQPSTGDVLAVAQNQAANASGPVALTGQYPPGSTFKIITAAAGLETGKIRADQPVPCPAVANFEGVPLPNDHNFDLGVVPETIAFAQSCNTTHGQLAADMPSDALPNQARQMGVGADYNIPGITTITGKVPAGRGAAEKANQGIGQGRVLASPFGMALAAATAAHGSTPTPNLIRGQQTTTDTPAKPLPQPVLDQLRPMMRAVVTQGTARSLGDVGEVYGKTGTAQFGPDGSHTHGWFVGYRGDMAFAVLVTDSGSNKPALDAAHQFLSTVPQ